MDKEEARELFEIMARIEQRLENIDQVRDDHEGRLRMIERSAIKHAFASDGLMQLFWILVAAGIGFLVSHFGSMK